jgi:hypothetical protein
MRFPLTTRARWLRLPLLAVAMLAALASVPVAALGAGDRSDADVEVVALEAPMGTSILNVASQAIGTYQGECFPWVKRVVAQATGAQMGFGYRDGYLSAGAIEVSLNDARGGDIIQIINDADAGPNADHAGMHTSIVSDVLGGGIFHVIDSNLAFDGIVRVRQNYNPMALAARYAGLSVHVYRFGASGAAPSAPQTTQPASFTTPSGTGTDTAPAPQQAASGTAVIRAQGDCLRLRSAPSTSAPVLTCLDDGSTVTLLGGTQQADGVVWQAVSAGGQSGWVASQYLVRTPSATAPAPSAPAAPAPVSSGPPPTAATTSSASIIGDLPSGGGLALIVFSGGSQDSLIGAISARGCAPVSVWTSQTGGGSLIGMIVGAPSVVNREWVAQYPTGTLAPSSPLIVVCRGASQAVVAQPPGAAAPSGSAERGVGPPGPAGNE